MRTVSDVEFNSVRAARAAPTKVHDFAWADDFAAWWYSPAGKLVSFAAVLVVVLTGLGILVFGMAALAGRLG